MGGKSKSAPSGPPPQTESSGATVVAASARVASRVSPSIAVLNEWRSNYKPFQNFSVPVRQTHTRAEPKTPFLKSVMDTTAVTNQGGY